MLQRKHNVLSHKYLTLIFIYLFIYGLSLHLITLIIGMKHNTNLKKKKELTGKYRNGICFHKKYLFPEDLALERK